MDFSEVESFFKNWGLFPCEENCEPYNRDVIENGINEPCFNRMLEQATEKYGKSFATFCSSIIEVTDNAFYLPFDTWEGLEDAWNNPTTKKTITISKNNRTGRIQVDSDNHGQVIIYTGIQNKDSK